METNEPTEVWGLTGSGLSKCNPFKSEEIRGVPEDRLWGSGLGEQDPAVFIWQPVSKHSEEFMFC